MPLYTRVASVNDLPSGVMKGVRVGRTEILIANLNGSLIAVGDICTHAQCNLSEGELEDNNVICPCHGGEFNLRTGVVEVGPPEANLPMYYVRVRDNDIEVGIPDE
jgi:nitrite reductase/ring-hydroxylating ferredoxin subunit